MNNCLAKGFTVEGDPCANIEENCANSFRLSLWPQIKRSGGRGFHSACALLAGAAVLLSFSVPALPQQNSGDLTQRSLEDLMNINVTSASKKEQKMSQVAGAVFVISQEDILRSGATNIPDLLRMAPGLDVAQINAHTWAISARGFNGDYSNKLLVMLDGRSVYTPTFSGVYWNVFDLPLEDIERIEIIRGPGGATWGANAVNGVINVITKPSSETQRTAVTGLAGTQDQGPFTVQHGGSLGKSGNYRSFVHYLNENDRTQPTNQVGVDQWHVLRGGFRLDTAPSAADHVMVQGDIYTGRQGNNTAGKYFGVPMITVLNAQVESNIGGGYLQSEWNHRSSSGSDTTVQMSFDRYRRTELFQETRNTFNFDFQNHKAAGSRQDLVWGAEYRYSASASERGISLYLDPADLNTQLFSAFLQNEIRLIPDHLSITAGTKLEHNYYTGFGVMPSLRATWNLDGKHMIWASVSRAIRTPSSVDTAIAGSLQGNTDTGIPLEIVFVKNRAFRNETELAYEAGSRLNVSNRLSIDISTYFNSYDSLRTVELVNSTSSPTPTPTPSPGPSPGPPPAPGQPPSPPSPSQIGTLQYGNKMHGETQGLEVAANLSVVRRWTLSPGYALELLHMHAYPDSVDTITAPYTEGSVPRSQAQLRSHLDLPRNFAWDASGYFTQHLTAPGISISSHTRIDTQLSWRSGDKLQFSLVGQNLAMDHYVEFVDPTGYAAPTMVKRSAYAKVTLRF
jgi:iron complex outermembrane receptor protein